MTTRLPAVLIALFGASAAGLYAVRSIRAESDGEPYKPIVEAKMPAQFPAYTGPGKVAVKQYPGYRKAEATVGSGSAFWTLFSHIKQNGIAMTAPVEMTYSESQNRAEESMAFLYQSSDIGTAGRNGKVEVLDVPAMTVISTGVRGPKTRESIDRARERLIKWLEANKSSYAADGSLRVMAYNSPFVPRDRNYFEVEIPIRPINEN